MEKILKCQATIPALECESEYVDINSGRKHKLTFTKREARRCRAEAKYWSITFGYFTCATCPSLLDSLREVTPADVEEHGRF